METLTVPIYVSEEQRELSAVFLSSYKPYLYQGAVVNNSHLAANTKKSDDAITCRFCKKNKSEVTFTQKTHLISELLGNSAVYSIDECDNCNLAFGKLENDLAAFLGLERTLEYPETDSLIPKFESKNKSIGVKKFPSGFYSVYSKKEDNEDLKFDSITGEGHIIMNTKPYRPTAVYQSILKMALGVLPFELLNEYFFAFNFLLNPELWPGLAEYKKIHLVKSELIVGKPFIIIFERLPQSNPIYAEHICCLYCFGYMFQFILPAGLKSINKTEVDMPHAPYIQLGNNGFNQIILERGMLDLTSNEKEFRDTSIHFKMNVDAKNIVGIPLGKEFFEELNK